MSEFIPVTSIEDLNTLDPDEMMEGYFDGLDGAPEPGNNHSRAYWHGWRNGSVDGKHREADTAQRLLSKLVIEQARAPHPEQGSAA